MVEKREPVEMYYLVSTNMGDRLVPAWSQEQATRLAQGMGYRVECVSKFTTVRKV